MATPTAIQTGLDVAANNAAPTPAPIATPIPVFVPDGLPAMKVTVSPSCSPRCRAYGEGQAVSPTRSVPRLTPCGLLCGLHTMSIWNRSRGSMRVRSSWRGPSNDQTQAASSKLCMNQGRTCPGSRPGPEPRSRQGRLPSTSGGGSTDGPTGLPTSSPSSKWIDSWEHAVSSALDTTARHRWATGFAVRVRDEVSPRWQLS